MGLSRRGHRVTIATLEYYRSLVESSGLAFCGIRPAIDPLDDSLPRLAEDWPEVAQLAALADGLRIGDARTRAAAERLLLDKLRAPA